MNWITAPKDYRLGKWGAERNGFQPIEELRILDWLHDLASESARRYARAEGAPLKLQTGHAWRTLRKRLQKRSELEVVQLLGALLRYANTDQDEASRLLFSAYVPLSLEHEAFSEYIGFETLGQLTNARHSIVLVRRTFKRWCEWLESLMHWEAHSRVHQNNTRRYELDRLLILLWPLGRRNQWTSAEWFRVLSMISRRPPKWFCQSAEELAARIKALGLKQPPTAEDEEENPPCGSSVALRYSHFWSTAGFHCLSPMIS